MTLTPERLAMAAASALKKPSEVNSTPRRPSNMRANSLLDLCQSVLLGILAIVENAHPLTGVIRRWVRAEESTIHGHALLVLEHSLFRCVGLTRR